MSEEAERPELDAVRRLLAEAREDEPMPDEVAARMDRVLAGLSGERTEAREDASVIPLMAHRRRRAAGLLVAAAAIVVGGVTAAQHLPGDSGPGTTAAGSATEDKVNGADAKSPEPPGKSYQISPGAKHPALRIRAGGVLVRPGHLTADALAGRQAAGVAPSDAVLARALRNLPAGCLPAVAEARVVPATYQKAPAALVYHAPAGTTQVVDLYVCGSSKPTRSVTLPTN